LEKLKEKDWEEIEQEALQDMFKLIKKHINIHLMSGEDGSSTVIEFDIVAETPKIYRNKEHKRQLEFNQFKEQEN